MSDKKTRELKEKLVSSLLAIVDGDIGDYYDASGEPKDLSELTKPQRFIIQDLFQGKYAKLYDKLKAADQIAKLTGMQEMKHTIANDEANPFAIKVEIDFLSTSAETPNDNV